MDNTLHQDILDSIKKNLPAATGAVLQERLALIDKLEAKLADTTAALERSKDQLAALSSTIAKHGLLTAREAEVVVREQKAQQQELELLKREAKVEAAVQRAIADTVMHTFDTVFKNPTVRTTVQRNIGIPVDGSPGGNGYCGTSGFVQQTDESETTTTVEE